MKKTELFKRIIRMKGMKTILATILSGGIVLGVAGINTNGRYLSWEKRVKDLKTEEYTEVYETGIILGDDLNATIDGRGRVTVKNTATGEKTIKGLKIDWMCESTGDSLAVFCHNGKRGYFNSFTGQIAVEPTYRRAWVFSEGLAAVQRDGMIGFIDHSGKTVIDFKYPYYGNPLSEFIFKNGMCVVADSTGKCGVIDKTGKWIINAMYDQVSITRDYAVVTLDGRRKQITYDGQVLNPFLFDYVTPITIWKEERTESKKGEVNYHNVEIETGYYIYVVGNRKGLMDKDCHALTPAEYSHIYALNDHMFRATLLDGKSEIILNTKGEILR